MKSLQLVATLLLILTAANEMAAQDLTQSSSLPNKLLVLHGKQLFIDDYVIADLKGVRKVLNQPVKHPRNPIMRKHKREFAISYGAVVWDPTDSLYKLWYQIYFICHDIIIKH